MATRTNLALATEVSSMLKADKIVVSIGGKVRTIKLENLMSSINNGNEQLLRQVAWGIPLLDETQSSTSRPMTGNTSAWTAYKSRIGRYLVTASGKAAKLSPSSSGVYADGTALDETKGSIMVIGPRLYYLVQNDSVTGIPYLWMSEMPISSHYVGQNGFNVIGAYKASISSGQLVSRSGVPFDSSGKTIDGYWNCAQSFGSQWGLVDYDLWKWVIMIGMSELQNTNFQSTLGYGVGGSSGISWDSTVLAMLCGATKSLGDTTGKIDISNGTNSSRISLLGIEDFYNLQWEFIQGVFFGSSSNSGQSGNEIFLYSGNRMPTSAELTSHPSGSYRQLTRLTIEGWLRTIIKGEYFDFFGSATGGDSSSYYGDYNYNNSTGQVLFVGGAAGDGASSGPFYVDSLYGWSLAGSNVGARPAFYGVISFVNGKDIV